MKIIHIGTRVQTIFGVLDEDGNVRQQIPVNLEVNSLSGPAFDEAFHLAISEREKIEASLSEEVKGE